MSNFRPPASEGDLGTPYVRYDPDDLRAAQDNHQRMLERTGQTQEQYNQALKTMYDLTKKQYEREGFDFFKGAASVQPVHFERPPKRKVNNYPGKEPLGYSMEDGHRNGAKVSSGKKPKNKPQKKKR